jgi:hypothetical protein
VLLFVSPNLFTKYKKGKAINILGIKKNIEIIRYKFLSLEVLKVISPLKGKGTMINRAATTNQEIRSKFAKNFGASGV